MSEKIKTQRKKVFQKVNTCVEKLRRSLQVKDYFGDDEKMAGA